MPKVDDEKRDLFVSWIKRSFDNDEYNVSKDIEECVYNKYKNNRRKYSSTILHKVYNLRNDKQLLLNKKVSARKISPRSFVNMDYFEMAHDELKKQRQLWIDEKKRHLEKIIKEAESESESESELFKCEKCLSRRCSYIQLQTRRSDESTTLFVSCRECGNRWKQ